MARLPPQQTSSAVTARTRFTAAHLPSSLPMSILICFMSSSALLTPSKISSCFSCSSCKMSGEPHLSYPFAHVDAQSGDTCRLEVCCWRLSDHTLPSRVTKDREPQAAPRQSFLWYTKQEAVLPVDQAAPVLWWAAVSRELTSTTVLGRRSSASESDRAAIPPPLPRRSFSCWRSAARCCLS